MKPVIYQIVVRYFGNTNTTSQQDGTIETNGCSRFADITETALQALKDLGVTHVWLTGCLRQATLTGDDFRSRSPTSRPTCTPSPCPNHKLNLQFRHATDS